MPVVTKDGKTILEVIEADLRVVGYEKITGLSSKKSFTIPTGTRPIKASLRAETQGVRWRADGPDPSATDGMLIASGERYDLYGADNIAAFEAIEATASATLHVIYWA